MKGQIDSIKSFCEDAKYYFIKFPSDSNQEFGKIITSEEIIKVDLDNNEIHRSIEYKNGDLLFVHDLKPKVQGHLVESPLQLLLNNLKEARAIELVYPNIFTWAYDGIGVKAYARIPSGSPKANTTISRYGGSENFIKILRKHLKNIGKMSLGQSPDYNFLDGNEMIEDTELSIGSLNLFNNMFVIPIEVKEHYLTIIKNSRDNVQSIKVLNILDMKYWAREINPDLISEAKHIKLKEVIPIDGAYDLYPDCIKALMALPHKGNRVRFLIARFLLSAHSPQDAKFVYMSILNDEERGHIKDGNCSSQWNFIMNNIQRYGCPTCRELKYFCSDADCSLVHPLEKIQKHLEEEKLKLNNDE
jgi:hypothetical protein